jgi:hypothetical protein
MSRRLPISHTFVSPVARQLGNVITNSSGGQSFTGRQEGVDYTTNEFTGSTVNQDLVLAHLGIASDYFTIKACALDETIARDDIYLACRVNGDFDVTRKPGMDTISGLNIYVGDWRAAVDQINAFPGALTSDFYIIGGKQPRLTDPSISLTTVATTGYTYSERYLYTVNQLPFYLALDGQPVQAVEIRKYNLAPVNQIQIWGIDGTINNTVYYAPG